MADTLKGTKLFLVLGALHLFTPSLSRAVCSSIHPSVHDGWFILLISYTDKVKVSTLSSLLGDTERDKCHAKLNIDSVLSLRPVLCPSDFVTPGNLNPIPELSGIPYNDDDQGGDRARQ